MIYMISCLMSHFAVVDIHVKLFQIMWYVKGSKGTALKAQFHTVHRHLEDLPTCFASLIYKGQ